MVEMNIEKSHACFYCCSGFDQTPGNPARTDWCIKCGHRGEGIMRTVKRGAWNIPYFETETSHNKTGEGE